MCKQMLDKICFAMESYVTSQLVCLLILIYNLCCKKIHVYLLCCELLFIKLLNIIFIFKYKVYKKISIQSF